MLQNCGRCSIAKFKNFSRIQQSQDADSQRPISWREELDFPARYQSIAVLDLIDLVPMSLGEKPKTSITMAVERR